MKKSQYSNHAVSILRSAGSYEDEAPMAALLADMEEITAIVLLQEIVDSIPSSYDGRDASMQRHAQALLDAAKWLKEMGCNE